MLRNMQTLILPFTWLSTLYVLHSMTFPLTSYRNTDEKDNIRIENASRCSDRVHVKVNKKTMVTYADHN